MRAAGDYLIDLAADPSPDGVAARARTMFGRVWRCDFSQPGFCLLDLGPRLDSHQLRALMLQVKGWLGDLCARQAGRNLVLRSLGRFDQQETTRFHRDGAPDQSLLVLGYEPSRVRSRLFLADYARCAFDLGLRPQQFLAELNPMFRKGEEQLAPYVTELPEPNPRHSRILLVNNSMLPFAPDDGHPLGVLHKAQILNPSAVDRRVVNSMLLVADAAEADAYGPAEQQDYVRTEALSPKVQV